MLSKREGLSVGYWSKILSHSKNFFREVSAFFVNISVIFVPTYGLLLVRVAVQNLKKYQT